MDQQDRQVLSFEQERVWFLDRMDPGNPAYNRPCALKLTGKLDADCLMAALQAIFDRHDNLRACFSSEHGVPYQTIRPSRPLDVRIVDCEASLQQQMLTEIRRSFDLAKDVLVRALLIRVTEEETILLLTFHHIIFDGWSVAVLHRELANMYAAFAQGVPPTLAPLPIQYADYAAQQRNRLTGPALEAGLRYWRQQLCEPLPVLELPFANNRPAVQTFAGGSVPATLTGDLLPAIKQLCRQERLTPFMVFVAALQALLYRYTGQTDCILGSMASGRNQQPTEPLIGLFVNTLALRSNLAGNPTFRELLQQVKKTTLEAYNHQEIPFAKLVAELNPQRSINRQPFSQIMINMHNMPHTEEMAPGLRIEELAIDDGLAPFDITLKITERKGEFTGALIFNTDLFDREAIARMAGHFTTLLAAAADTSDMPIANLPLLTEAERQTLLVSWSGRMAEYPREKSLVQLFAEQVERNPDAPAVRYKDRLLSYGELNRRANQLAHYLIGQGVSPGTRVGVCLARSPEVIISFFAILKAGGIYVPLDPAYPAERLSFMAEASDLSLFITDEAQEKRIRTGKISSIFLDRLEAELTGQGQENPALQTAADQVAYIMFTSGSTGQPKAVPVTHRGVARLVKNPDFDFLKPDQVFLQLSAVAFDFSTFEIYGALLNGAQLAMIDADLPSLEQIGETIRRHQVTTICAGPELLTLFVKTRIRDLFGVQQVLSGGDVLPPALVNGLQQAGCRVLNIYGPTENTVCTTMFEAPAGWPAEAVVPIGRPIANDFVAILDQQAQPVPIGIPGELYVTGDGLTSGYANNPELTAEKFIANPFPETPHDRLYKTGDIVKWLPDSTIAFLGRRDNQVKVRGCRIELGEIETVLGGHPAVNQVHVAVRKGGSEEKTVVAYVVAKESRTVDPAQLRDYLRTKLPDYMLPAAFVFLAQMPLTPVGKIDQAALPAPQFLAQDNARQVLGPRNEQERTMAELWERILDRRPIGIQDGFFDLGGHSLLGMRLMADIEKTFGERLPVSLLFTADTIEKLCRQLFITKETFSSRLVPIQVKGANPPLFCVHAIDGEVISYRNLAMYLGEEQPLYGLVYDFQSVDPAEDLDIDSLAARYIREIQKVQPNGPYYLIGYSLGGMIAYEMAQQLRQAGYAVDFLALIDTANPERHKQGTTPTTVKLAHRIGKFWAKSVQDRKTYLIGKLRKAWSFIGPERNATLRIRKIKKELKKAHRQYIPAPYPGRLTLFRALDREKNALSQDRTMGWEGLIAGGITVCESPSTHGEMINRKNIGHLADNLIECLKEARQKHD
ncbi:MAG: tycC2 [Firmicutes bacterium]|nr:tycC2 [Bacillota bacterium]